MLSEKEMMIISQLRRNARQPLVRISNATGVPVSTIYDKIKAHEGSVIKKYSAFVDFPKLGFNIRKKMLVKAKDPKGFLGFALKSRHVNSIYKISEGFDFLLDCIFMYMQEHEEFTKEIEQQGILKKQEFFVTDVPKQESFLNDYQNKNNIKEE